MTRRETGFRKTPICRDRTYPAGGGPVTGRGQAPDRPPRQRRPRPHPGDRCRGHGPPRPWSWTRARRRTRPPVPLHRQSARDSTPGIPCPSMQPRSRRARAPPPAVRLRSVRHEPGWHRGRRPRSGRGAGRGCRRRSGRSGPCRRPGTGRQGQGSFDPGGSAAPVIPFPASPLV